MTEIQSESEYEGQDFDSIDLKKVLISQSEFQSDCKLTDFAGSVFSKTNLTKADFSDARNYTIDVRANTIAKMKLSLPEALSLLETLEIMISNK